MHARFLAAIALAAFTLDAAPAARPDPFDYPAPFRTEDIASNGTRIHVRIGGSGPAVVLLHGYGDTGDMWRPLAIELARDHTVVVPDLRGMGLSEVATEGFTKQTRPRMSRACSTR